MKKRLFPLLLAASVLPGAALAQTVDRTKYRDYSDQLRPDASLLTPKAAPGAKAAAKRPDHVNNAETPYFPPVFNQDGGSCGSASRICYMFSHEMNAFRGTDGKDPNNYYPSHFVWLLTNGNSGKEAFVMNVGVPSAAVYGGQTFSKLFGYQEEVDCDFGWMTGYEKWYSAMFNRMISTANFPLSVQTEEGREAVKNWLWNHNGDPDFHAGGLAGIGVASGGDWQGISSTPVNDELGVTGKYYVNKWGTSVDHALTIVGYDDRIEFDLNGNGVYGEASADEKGAWIVVNSWSPWWCNDGFIYCPYAHGGAWFNQDGTMGNSWWYPEVYHVRKNYRPLRTMKVRMDYSRRSELLIGAGVSTDLEGSEPQTSIAFDHFKYAGDGRNGDSIPAPEVPMLGRWADGKLHDEPMEFGYDLTDLSEKFDQDMPLKYFLTIQTKGSAVGSGHVYDLSVIDYYEDEAGVETPCEIAPEGVEVKNSGETTVISFVVQGRGLYAPRNASIAEGVLSWNAPVRSGLELTGYRIYRDGNLVGETDAQTLQFTLPNAEVCSYGLAAVYGAKESGKVAVEVPVTKTANYYANLSKSGFSVPDVFGAKLKQATIEFWMNCNSLLNWNQMAGPGWGQFLFHANSDGTFSAGWDTENRLNIGGALAVGSWKHIAIVVDGNNLKVYVNGEEKGDLTSEKYSGIGGFGDLVFSANSGSNAYTDAKIDELRIWKTARTAEEIAANKNVEFGNAGAPADLLAYFKGDLITLDGNACLRDHSGHARHAKVLGGTCRALSMSGTNVKVPAGIEVALEAPSAPVYLGMPVTLKAVPSLSAHSLAWTAAGAQTEGAATLSPTLVFDQTGKQQVSVTATTLAGESATASAELEVLACPAPDAAFSATKSQVAAGERVSFLPKHPMTGFIYHWEMPGAEVEEAFTPNAAATYNEKGTYTVRLTVTTPDGQTASGQTEVTVSEVAPLAGFDVSPATVVKGRAVTLIDKSKYAPTEWHWMLQSKQATLVGEGDTLCFAPEKPGYYDVQLTVANEMGTSVAQQEKALIVCNADSKNGLNFSYDAAQVTLEQVPMAEGDKNFTIDWWMKPSTLQPEGNAMGDKASSLLLYTTSAGEMVVQMADKTVRSEAGLVVANEWHHYAVAYLAGAVRFFRDGVQLDSKSNGVSSLPQIAKFAIGSSEMPFKGQIDEFRIWGKTLTAAQLKSYINQPIEAADVATAESQRLLKVYYQFNQSGGDVTDLTSNGNKGLRSGFGPDGDAWGLSSGVFSLNFEAASSQDVTSRYLSNYKEEFRSTGKLLNEGGSERFKELADWTQENMATEPIRTGAHVDTDKFSDLTITTGWDGFASELEDLKVYQTMTLPAGAYCFTATYGQYEGNGAGSYLAVAAGKGLPNSADLETKALGYMAMEAKSDAHPANSLNFVLTEQTEVSLGMVVNMNGKNCATFQSFSLMKSNVETIVPLPTSIAPVSPDAPGTTAPLYDILGRRVWTPVRGGVYIRGGQKIVVK